MAFPTIIGRVASSTNSGTSHTVTLVDGSSGDLLIVLFAVDGSSDQSISVPTGWTAGWADELNSCGNSFALRYKIADGSEGTSVDITTAGNEATAHLCIRIAAGTFNATTPLEFASVENVGCASVDPNPDPPSLTPSWGAADTLWIACYGADNDQAISAYPTNYNTGQTYVTTGGSPSTRCSLGSAERDLNATSDDPSAYTIGASTEWITGTIAVQPAAGGADHGLARMHAFRGVKTSGNPYNITSGNVESASDTSLSATGATTTALDCLVCVLAGLMDDDQDFGATWTNADLANINVRSNTPGTSGNDGRHILVTGEKASSGAYGATTNTLTASSVKAMMTIALEGAPNVHNGTGAVSVPAPGIVGVGLLAFLGAAALGVTQPAVAGSGSNGFSGTGTLGVTQPAVAGSGALEFSATGALSVTVPSVSGTGVVASAFYVATDGLSTNDGSIGSPWNLAYALSGAGGTIQPGDTIWIRGGTYTQGPQWNQTVSGTFGADDDDISLFVKFRNFAGEKVSITNTDSGADCMVVDATAYVWWATVGQNEGIEFWRNVTERTGSPTARGTAVWARSVPQDGKFIHVVTRDGANGLFTGNGAGSDFRTHLELYGHISYNNGTDASPRTHGIYARHWRETGRRFRITGGMLFNQLGHGIQIFGTATGDGISDFEVADTIIFGAGTLGTLTSSWVNYLIGGGGNSAPARGCKTLRCPMFQANNAGSEAQVGHIGSSGATNEDEEFSDNYIVGGINSGLAALVGVQPHRVDGQPSLTFERNFVSANGGTARAVNTNQTGSLANYTSWANNDYRFDPAGTNWRQATINKTFATWKTDTGLGATDTAVAPGDPTVNKVFVVPLTKYNPGYGHVCFFNWELSGTVAVDLSSILAVNDTYEVYNVQDIFGAPVLSGTYSGGTVAFPTTGKTPPAPVGTTPRTAPTTAPFFDAFLVRATEASAPTGSGALAATASVAGSGTLSFSGPGALAVTVPAVAGSGAQEFTATGALSVAAPSIDGTGTQGIGLLGGGSLGVPAPTIAGTGTQEFTATGALTATASIAGTSEQVFAGSGALAVTAPALAGTGLEEFPATGSLTASAAVAGSGALEFAGSGAITVPRPVFVGGQVDASLGVIAVDARTIAIVDTDSRTAAVQLRHGSSIMDTYTTSNATIRTSDASPHTSKGPMRYMI